MWMCVTMGVCNYGSSGLFCILTLRSRKQSLSFSFGLGQFPGPQQNLSKVFLRHVFVGRIHVLTLKERTEKREINKYLIRIIALRESQQ